MSIHSSFGKGGAAKRHRSVAKRYEKLQMLRKKELWDESKGVWGLPKVKMLKIRVKKEKAKEEAAPEGAQPAPAAGAAAAAEAKAKPRAKE